VATELDPVMVNPAADPTHLAVLQEERKAGRVRYIGVQVISDDSHPQLEAVMRNEPIDFIGVDDDFGRVGTTPLPEWAAELDARSWAQFFLEYVIGHPAVTVARAGTTKATHMLDDIGSVGRLPDEMTRKRMAALTDALPAVAPRGPQAPQQWTQRIPLERK
jgi:aryl-alcohol dehydrogenase-like predicted oxidoreductase